MAYNINDDVIDSRDIVERIDELTEMLDLLGGAPLDDDDADELQMLTAAVAEINNYGGDDASDGVALIADRYFVTYAQELAEEVGAIDPNAGWPTRCIDWEQAARELQMAYTCIDIDGRTFWYR